MVWRIEDSRPPPWAIWCRAVGHAAPPGSSPDSTTMDPIVVVFVLVNAIALMIVPRKWALLPLIAGSCLMTRGQAIELGVATLTVVRILVAVGILRVIARREWAGVGFNALDGLMLVWGLWMIATAPFHAAHDTSFVLRVRDVYEAWGLY